MGSLSELVEFVLNPQILTCSVALPRTSRINNSENQEPTGDRSTNDRFPETEFSASRTSNLIESDQEQAHHIVKRVQLEIPYCSLGSFSGKLMKARSTSQPKLPSENTPAKIEASQILLALQQLATNSNSDNFNNNIKRISKLPKSLTTTKPTFDGQSEKFERFQTFFPIGLKLQKQLTELDKINYF